MTYTIHSSNNGERAQNIRLTASSAVARARMLASQGWVVYIVDREGVEHGPDRFEALLITGSKD